MMKRMLNWGLILSRLFTMLPVAAMAAEDELAGDGLTVAESAQCICGAETDEAGIAIRADGCPLTVQEEPPQETEDPPAETEQPSTETEESVLESLTPPFLTCELLDETSSSDIVLTTDGRSPARRWGFPPSCSRSSAGHGAVPDWH